MWVRKAKGDYFMYLFLTSKLYPVKDEELFYNKNWGTQFLRLNFCSIVFARAGAQPAGVVDWHTDTPYRSRLCSRKSQVHILDLEIVEGKY